MTTFAEFLKEAEFMRNCGRCPICHNPVTDFRDALSETESAISGLCQNCQDSIFAEEQCNDE